MVDCIVDGGNQRSYVVFDEVCVTPLFFTQMPCHKRIEVSRVLLMSLLEVIELSFNCQISVFELLGLTHELDFRHL